MKKATHKFKVEKAFYTELSKDEKKILPILANASLLVGELYLQQEKDQEKYPGAAFYPPDVSDEEIEEAARKNPQILSPFTIIEKDSKGIIAIRSEERRVGKECR